MSQISNNSNLNQIQTNTTTTTSKITPNKLKHIINIDNMPPPYFGYNVDYIHSNFTKKNPNININYITQIKWLLNHFYYIHPTSQNNPPISPKISYRC
jgi:hypothetical protein